MEPVPTKAAGGWFEISSQAFEWPKEVDGFNLSYLRDWASQALITQDEYAAPLLAFGPRGTGRTAAVSFPLGGEHSQRVRDWPKYGDFLQTQVRWLMGETVPPGIGVRHRIDGNTLTLDLIYDEEWEPKLRAKAPRVALAHGLRAEGSQELAWERVAPGHFQTSTELPEGEMVRGAVQVGGQAISFGPAIVGTSTEWAFDESRVEELRRVSQTSGGRELLEMSQAWRSPTIPRFTDLGLYLIIATLLLLLFEAFVTRTGWKLPRLARSEATQRPKLVKPTQETLQHQQRLQQTPQVEAPKTIIAEVEAKAEAVTDAERQSRFNRAKRR